MNHGESHVGLIRFPFSWPYSRGISNFSDHTCCIFSEGLDGLKILRFGQRFSPSHSYQIYQASLDHLKYWVPSNEHSYGRSTNDLPKSGDVPQLRQHQSGHQTKTGGTSLGETWESPGPGEVHPTVGRNMEIFRPKWTFHMIQAGKSNDQRLPLEIFGQMISRYFDSRAWLFRLNLAIEAMEICRS